MVDLAIASATAERSAGPYRVDVGADQIVLLGRSHNRLGFSLLDGSMEKQLEYRSKVLV